MNKNKFVILVLAFFILFPLFVNGQITEKERRELEERFKKLKTFYIDDDGLVVYYTYEVKADTLRPEINNIENPFSEVLSNNKNKRESE